MSVLNFFHSYVPSPTIVSWGDFSLHWYGLLFAASVALGYLVARRTWLEKGWPLPHLEQLVSWLVLAGLVGARLVDVFLYEWWYFRDHLGDILRLWEGGLAFHGGLAAAFLMLMTWAKKRGYSWLTLGDVLAPALALAQALGRWGNYFNQELFGVPTNLPWGIPIVRAFRPVAQATSTHFHPVFLYEFMGLLVIAAVLWRSKSLAKAPGRLFAAYLISTGVLRFILEFIRIDAQLEVAGVRIGSLVAALVILAGVWLWWRSPRSAAASSPLTA